MELLAIGDMHGRKRFGDGVRIDHVLFCGRDLEAMVATFSQMGLPSEYGGEHDSKPTHNSLIGFEDGGYVELLTTTGSTVDDVPRTEFMRGNAGPCGWAVESDDVDAVVERAEAHGIEVSGPVSMDRKSPSGDCAAWTLVTFGSGIRGTILPMVINDTEPRSHRITPTVEAGETGMLGISDVVVGVRDLESWSRTFRTVLDLEEPIREIDESGSTMMASFPKSPVLLASPVADSGWLADRIDRFGEGLCSFLLRVDDEHRLSGVPSIETRTNWFERDVWLLDLPSYGGRVGFTV